MAGRRGRRWRVSELTGKQKAQRVLEALNNYAGLVTNVSIDEVLRQKLGLKTTPEREAYRKAYRRWRLKIIAEWSEAVDRGLHEQPTEEKQRQPLGPKPAGMVWRDGCWQDIQIPPTKRN